MICTIDDFGEVSSTTSLWCWWSVTHTESPGSNTGTFLAPRRASNCPSVFSLLKYLWSLQHRSLEYWLFLLIAGTVVCKRRLISNSAGLYPTSTGVKQCQIRVFRFLQEALHNLNTSLCLTISFRVLRTAGNTLKSIIFCKHSKDSEANCAPLSEITTSGLPCLANIDDVISRRMQYCDLPGSEEAEEAGACCHPRHYVVQVPWVWLPYPLKFHQNVWSDGKAWLRPWRSPRLVGLNSPHDLI